MPKYQFDHIHLNSPNISDTANFYEKTFGAKRVKNLELPGGRKGITLSMDGVPFLITPPRDPAAASGVCKLEHFGFKTDNIEKAVAELKAKGIKFPQEIMALTPKTKIAFFETPDGLRIELMEGSL